MKNELLAASNLEAASQTASLLCAVKFLKNKKRNFESVVALSSKASLYIEQDGQYLAGFAKTKSDAHLAMATLEEMRLASWDLILFANGRVQPKKNALTNVLDCYCTAANFKDPKQHCHKLFDAPMEHFADSSIFKFALDELGEKEVEEKSWLVPCQHLEGHIRYTSREQLKDPAAHIKNVAEIRLVSVCPLFDLSAFKIIEKPKSVPKPKRYW